MPGHPIRPHVSPDRSTTGSPWRILTEFSLPSTPGSERQAMERVALFARTVGMRPAALERLKTAVAEATLNAIEHGNHYRAELPVHLTVLRSATALRVDVCDEGSGEIPPPSEPPDLQAKLAGIQSPRGWGLFLIQHMVDEMNVTSDPGGHTIQLIVYLSYPIQAGASDANQPPHEQN